MSFVSDEIKDRLSNLSISCPECENIDDLQYSCITCGCNPPGTITVINALKLLKSEHKYQTRIINQKIPAILRNTPK